MNRLAVISSASTIPTDDLLLPARYQLPKKTSPPERTKPRPVLCAGSTSAIK